MMFYKRHGKTLTMTFIFRHQQVSMTVSDYHAYRLGHDSLLLSSKVLGKILTLCPKFGFAPDPKFGPKILSFSLSSFPLVLTHLPKISLTQTRSQTSLSNFSLANQSPKLNLKLDPNLIPNSVSHPNQSPLSQISSPNLTPLSQNLIAKSHPNLSHCSSP